MTSAADKKSVLLSKVTRQNREYLERIKELEEQLENAKSTKITERSSLEPDSTNELMSLIDDEDCKSREGLISESELTDDPPIVRKKRKRLISDCDLTNDSLITRKRVCNRKSQRANRKKKIKQPDFSNDKLILETLNSDNETDQASKTIKKSSRQVPFNELPLRKSRPKIWTQETIRQRSKIGTFIRIKIKKSKLGNGRVVYTVHECKCWILFRVGTGNPMFLFRKGQSSEHEKLCQAAVKTGNKFFKLINCDGHQIAIGETGYAKMEWCKMFGFDIKHFHEVPGISESPDVEYFKTPEIQGSKFQ